MSSSGVWKQRSGARCGTAGFPEQMLPYRSALRAACNGGMRPMEGELGVKKMVNGYGARMKELFGSQGESSPSAAGTSEAQG